MTMRNKGADEAILAKERHALDRWSKGDPSGYAEAAADDMTYFDDIGAQARVDGIAAVRGYLATLEGQIHAHRYEIVDPRVQVYGDVGILTLRYHPSSLDGEALSPWKTTVVYRQIAEEWRMVHANWSTVKVS
jgi:ketosteroid isomerase-like protein